MTNRVPNIIVDGILFNQFCNIEPDRDKNGRIREFQPQNRYEKANTTRLNPNGRGPFCRIKIFGLPPSPGVYAVTVESEIAYIGRCGCLSDRWGLGQYGSIQPENCFVRGQSTNCKINHNILIACKQSKIVELWFHKTENFKCIESQLISKNLPPWNGANKGLVVNEPSKLSENTFKEVDAKKNRKSHKNCTFWRTKVDDL